MVLLLLFVASGGVYLADNLRGMGVYWAQNACWQTGSLCDNSLPAAIVAACALIAYALWSKRAA
jgi:hypothetical protein